MGDHFIIEGVTVDGKPFRPSDWIERLSSALASFGPDQRLRYSSYVSPCIINGQKCLLVQRDFAEVDAHAYEFVLKFARDNRLRIKAESPPEGRRAG